MITSGAGQPFEPGMPIGIVVQVNDPQMQPTIEVWEDMVATIIPGIRIGPRDFVRLQCSTVLAWRPAAIQEIE